MYSDRTTGKPKSVELLKKAEECFGLAKVQHDIADQQHDIAARQLDIAAKQLHMGNKQHRNADAIDANSQVLKAMGHALEADAAAASGGAPIDVDPMDKRGAVPALPIAFNGALPQNRAK